MIKFKNFAIWGHNLGQLLFTCFGLVITIFFLSKLSPIDPVLSVVGDNASAETYQLAKHALGLDLPSYQQFYQYIVKIFHGDFGYSLLTNNLVITDIKRVFPATIELATTALILAVFIGIPLGILSAIYHNKWPDHLIRIISLFGNSISIFWLGLIGLLIFYAKLAIAPSPGRISFIHAGFPLKYGFLLVESLLTANWEIFFDALHHIMLPAILLAYYNLSNICRMTRSFMLEQYNQEYVFTAKIKGLPEWYIICFHILPNVAIPLITVIILSYGTLLEGSTFIEIIFLWPGLGYYLTQSLLHADLNATLAGTLIIGVIFIVFNILADCLYRKLDPRIAKC